jgi:DNA-binding NarL/FixJ family response regulator
MYRVLIVEDNAIFRGFLKDALGGHFPWVEVSEAPNAEIALRKIAAAPPDLIFMDIGMPGRSGLELARTVRSSHPSIAIVFLTGCDLPEYREAAEGLKAVQFLSKGTARMDEIVRLVESLLPEHRVDVSGDDPA